MITEEEIRKGLDGTFVTVSMTGVHGMRVVHPEWVPDYHKMIKTADDCRAEREAARTARKYLTRGHLRWTPEEDEKLRQMLDADKTTNEISLELGRTYWAVIRRAELLRLHPGRIVPLRNAAWTPAMRQQVFDLRQQKVTWKNIAAMMGVSARGAQFAFEYHRDQHLQAAE